MTPSRTRSALVVLVVAGSMIAAMPGARALQIPQSPGRFAALAIPDPSLEVSTAPMPADDARVPAAARTAWGAFRALNGPAWDVYLDGRSGAPLLVQGQGIPFIPGSGNALQSAKPVTLDSLADALRVFAAKNASLLAADDKELVLNREASGQITADLWQVEFDRAVSGVPVAGDRYLFYVGHGNLIAFGASRWSAITTDTTPSIPAVEAQMVLANAMGLQGTEGVELYEKGTLTLVPMAAEGTSPESFEGAVGTGYRTALAWRISLGVEGEASVWVGLVDAHAGTLLALYDDTKYAQAKGGIQPLSNDGSCPTGCEQANYPMPWANITIGASSSATSGMGAFTCSPGGSTATTTLAGTYVKVVDTCGAISVPTTCDSDLDLKTSAGTDCTVPSGTSAGNTHAARTGFYHLNRIKEHARSWLPANTWLTQQLTDNVNINNTCNAFWSPTLGTVNFYRSGGGCNNTGEIAAVFLHEWGHGLDQNDGGGNDNPGEAYADISSFVLTHASCIGRGFTASNCSGYGNACLNCTGVRDVDWNQRANHAPQTPENWPASCPSGTGPCSKEVHCEAYLAAETLWDLAVRDLPAAGVDQQTAWQLVDRMWFKSRQGSGGNAYSCGSPASNRSCAATTWFTKLRTVDDDDGNLANGTPHAAQIFSAFNRHNIPCGASTDASNLNTSSCPVLAAPTVTAAGSPGAIALSWAAVPNAASYNVLRNDQGCNWGYTIVATVTGTSYTDTTLPNSFPLYYAVQPVGSNASCLGALSSCTTAQAGGPHAAYSSTARVADTCGSGGTGSNDGIYDPGEQIQFSVTLRNDGASALTGVSATLTPVTAGVTMVNGTASYGSLAVGASGTSASPHYTALLPTGLACGSAVSYNISITANEGSWTGSFTQTVGQPLTGGGTVLSESFSGGIPGTWSVVDGGSGGGAAATWTTANPGARTFTSPIASPAVIVDSDNAGSAATQDEQLITPVLNLSSATAVTLAYDEYFRWYNGGLDEKGDVDVKSSLTGGAWVNVVRNQGAATNNPNHRTVDITAQAAGASNVQLRFHYYSAQYEWYWQVDNVVVTWTGPAGCTMHACTGPVCGNGALEAGEQCDDGNTQNGDCCSSACQYEAAGSSCGSAASNACTSPDTCNAAGQCQANNAPNGTACSDGSACTQTDTCQSGACTGANPVTCTAQDQCHTAGVCNPATGVCSNPAKPDGTACSDGSACTQTDTCQSGACAGANPVVCAALDQCHDAGACNPATGACSDPAKPDGTACSDGNACTQTDTCEAGACAGANPVVCTALDQCHDAGACNPATGACSDPAKPDGTACSDGNACTQTDTCQSGACAGANPVVCAALDQCHDAGACNPATGACSNPAKPDGTACVDGDACTAPDVCTAGLCAGAAVAPLAEVAGQRFSSRTLQEWDAVATLGPAPVYDVVRGLAASLPVGSASDQCRASGLAAAALPVAEDPSAGDAFWYLVRARNVCSTGTWGTTSGGVPRSSSVCP